jgi:rhamnose utilization protein RhaD (predicted bifunctional aldolase and dehydrogenase)/NAD(P)-dependent dehydrogenase (short-subunit alcohol dehydrogenase family)
MRTSWSDRDAHAAITSATATAREDAASPHVGAVDLALRVYSSRLIGREPGLVLHGGGNTSVKTTLHDDLGRPVEVLCVKGSGWDLATIEAPGFPAIKLGELQALRALPSLSDEAMVNAARTRLLDASAPNPSVETLLHAFLPAKFIDHSHADAILALVDQAAAVDLCREVFAELHLGVVPYIMPGFALSKLAAEVHDAYVDKHGRCDGLLLLQHGLFTFGATARESYERHITAVTRAETHLARARGATSRGSGAKVEERLSVEESASVEAQERARYTQIAPLLRGLLGANARRYILHLRQSAAIRAFTADDALASLSQRGPATPDHVIRTKQHPLVLTLSPFNPASARAQISEDFSRFRARYHDYFARQTAAKDIERRELDPEPRVLLIRGGGPVTAGADESAARVAADIYEHTISVIRDAERVGAYRALPEGDIFDMEYWSLEQAKLGRKSARPLDGQVVYISGAAGGIGRACAHVFAAAGAHLYLSDRDLAGLERVAASIDGPCAIEALDVRERTAVERSVDAAVRRFGGLDGIVSNAGVASQAPIADCPPDVLHDSFAINLFSHQWLAAAATKVLRAQGTPGFLLFNASKAAFNPGRGFGPYAVAKAALVALMKQYAIEGGPLKIRANAINADRVRTGLLPEEVVAARARARGLETSAYFRANLLAQEVLASDVAAGFLHLALATNTTGAVLTVDGGNIAASAR